MSSSLFDLSGKVAIVTGASRGLGNYMARALARAGADLVITSRDVSRVADFQSELKDLGCNALALALDVTEENSIRKMVEQAENHVGRLDILVNNAGCNNRKPALEVTWDDWNTILDTNLRGTFFMAQAVAPYMIKGGYGRIINIGSLTSVAGYAGLGPYCASKGGVSQLTKSLADEWGAEGVTVNCIAPGWFKTALNTALYDDPDWVATLLQRLPLGRPGAPGDLDGAVVFLASESSCYVTGQTLLVDGGFSTQAMRALPS